MNRNMIVVIGIGIAVVLVAIGYIGGYFAEGDGADGKDVTDGGAPRAPYGIYLKAGENSSFKYAGHNISAEFVSNNNKRIITIVVDGKLEVIEKNISDDPRGVSININNVGFFIRPVVWKENYKGNLVPFKEKTWNVTEIDLEVTKT